MFALNGVDPCDRRHADPLGATESRGLQASAVVKQNDFLKGYIVRLQNQLEEYLGSHAPLSEAVLPHGPERPLANLFSVAVTKTDATWRRRS